MSSRVGKERSFKKGMRSRAAEAIPCLIGTVLDGRCSSYGTRIAARPEEGVEMKWTVLFLGTFPFNR